MNFYPIDTRNHRLNMQVIDVNRSPVSSAFGYYVGGQKGTTLRDGVLGLLLSRMPIMSSSDVARHGRSVRRRCGGR